MPKITGKMDPYAILICRTQEQKSTVASGQGEEPEWNENFTFIVSEEVSELKIKLMDSDTFSSDDFVGEANIPLEPVFQEGSVLPTPYNVVKDQEYCGEVKVGLTFTSDEQTCCGENYEQVESYGCWKESSEENYEQVESYGGWKESTE